MARSAITKPQLRKAGDLTISGLDGILDNVNNILNKTRAEELKGVFMEAGKVLRDRAKANAPVRTGLLRSAIFVAPGKPDHADVIAGVSRSKKKTGAPSAPHGLLIEYGTVKMSSRPFFRPAITETKDTMGKIIITGVRQIIEDAVK